jgi:hypothetical protein
MPVPTLITDLSTTIASNSPSGSESPASLDDYQRAHAAFIAQLYANTVAAATVIVPSATTTDIGAAASENVDISGNTTITGFGTVAEGINRKGRFTGVLTLTHNATSLILPGNANITTANNDRYEAQSLGGGNWIVTKYVYANGSVISATNATNAANALTASHLANGRDTWATGGNLNDVAGQLGWKNYGNGHTIIDASAGTAPNGAAINNTNPTVGWSSSYPTLVGWNGSDTFGVRVDSARVADTISGFASSAENAAGAIENKAVDPLGIREAFNATGTAPVYACRAWVRMTGAGGILGSGNVSSVTNNGTGDNTINFATALPDANYVPALGAGRGNTDNNANLVIHPTIAPTASALRVVSCYSTTAAAYNATYAAVAIFR